MNILLCNDDGYNAEGLKLLRKKLQKYGRVIVVAPLKHMSAKSASLSFSYPYKVKKIKDDYYALDGTPCDCCDYGLRELSTKIDLVVAGCNCGTNCSYDVMFSGTIGICSEAKRSSYPCIAFSCESDGDGLKVVDKYFDDVMKFIISNKLLSNEYYVNVNFPAYNVPYKGIRLSKLYERNDRDVFSFNKGHGLDYYDESKNNDPETDLWQLKNGYISVVPLTKTVFSSHLYNKIKKVVEKNSKPKD
ncbi:MAG: 5'/3'-nucleotidase SurE [Bacilli bacterium]